MQQHLVTTKKKNKRGYDLLETAEPREGTSFCHTARLWCLCSSTHIWHMDSIRELINNGMLDKDYYAAVSDYDNAVLHGIVKIASKMGISTIQSYQGSKIFEAIGISQEVIETYFPDTVSRVGGITLEDIQKQVDDSTFCF